MDDDWESVADQEVVIRPKVTDVNKWLGEDEDDVKDSWEEDEEKKDEEKVDIKSVPLPVPVKTKPNKAAKTKLEEQERQEAEDDEHKLENMTAEEKLAEKLRLQKIQEESDLKSALETFGVKSIAGGLDAFVPVSKEEFKEFGAALSLKISQYKQSAHYPQFAEDLIRNICVNLSAADMKKCKICIETLHTEKLKLEKQTAKKPSGKSKTKVSLRQDNTAIENFEYTNDYDDYDDFM